MEVTRRRAGLPAHLLGLGLLAAVGAAALPAETAAAGAADAPDAPGAVAARLEARAAGAAPADGRSMMVIEVHGGPPRDEDEREDAPELPLAECKGAAVLPARGAQAPLLLAPAHPAGLTLPCEARLRGASAPFSVVLTPPSPGLYAAATPPLGRSGQTIQLRPFIVGQDGKTRPPRGLRAAASAGGLTLTADGLTVTPPPGPPRALAVALFAEGRSGAAFVPLVGRMELPVKVSRAADVTVRLGGRHFGPVPARGTSVTLQIDVAPGLTTAVVRAVSRGGETREEVAALTVPELPRIAAVAAEGSLLLGGKTTLAVAVAAPNGGPAPRAARLSGRAVRGELAAAEPRGPGLFEVLYTAPRTAGTDSIAFGVDGDVAAGTAQLEIEVTEGPRALPPAVVVAPTQPARPAPPARTLALGAFAGGGYLTNVGDLQTGRFGGGLALRKELGRFDLALSIGVEGYTFSDEVSALLGGAERTVSRTVTTIAVPVMLRARLPLGRFGLSVAGGVGPLHVRGRADPGFEEAATFARTLLDARGEIGADVRLGPGNVVAAFTVGRAKLEGTPITGNVDGLAVHLCYEWWFAVLGR
jgi:hypothetical protein